MNILRATFGSCDVVIVCCGGGNTSRPLLVRVTLLQFDVVFRGMPLTSSAQRIAVPDVEVDAIQDVEVLIRNSGALEFTAQLKAYATSGCVLISTRLTQVTVPVGATRGVVVHITGLGQGHVDGRLEIAAPSCPVRSFVIAGR